MLCTMGDTYLRTNCVKRAILFICLLMICFVLPLTESFRSSKQLQYTQEERASKYHLTIPVQLAGNNTPLQTLSTLKSPDSHLTSTRYRIQRDNQTEWILELQLNNAFISKTFKLFYYDEETGQAASSSHFEHCFYHGQLEGLEGSSATINTCNQKGISGMIFDGVDLYHIEKSPDEQSELHMVYKSEDKLGETGTCGVTEDRDSEDTHSRDDGQHPITHNWSAHLLRRKRARATKFTELILILDNTHYRNTGSNMSYSLQYAIEIANHMDFVYKSIGIRVALVGVEVWNTVDQITTDPDFTVYLNSWVSYLPELFKMKKEEQLMVDNAQLITGIANDNSNVIGRAQLSTMCFSGSGGVNRDTNGFDATRIATTICHEMGHNFGMSHDDTRPCNDCPDIGRGCIMNAIIRSPQTFTTCSVDDLHEALMTGVGMCIYNEPDTLFTDPLCGNGFLEEGEECDCGTAFECNVTDPCCNPDTCTLFSFALCSTGPCCNNCTFSSNSKICRKIEGDCDIDEFCPGNSGVCPENLFKQNGHSCMSPLNASSYCLNGACRTLKDQCKSIWGDYRESVDYCYETINILGNRYGHCGLPERNVYQPCAPENVKCGKLLCNVPKNVFPVFQGSYTIQYNFFEIENANCTSINYQIGDTPDPGLALDGTKCSNNSVCFEGVCTDVKLLITNPCPIDSDGVECAGGVCSNIGECVYPPNFAAGDGSSNVAAIVAVICVIVILITLLVATAVVLLGLYYYYKKSGFNVKYQREPKQSKVSTNSTDPSEKRRPPLTITAPIPIKQTQNNDLPSYPGYTNQPDVHDIHDSEPAAVTRLLPPQRAPPPARAPPVVTRETQRYDTPPKPKPPVVNRQNPSRPPIANKPVKPPLPTNKPSFN